MEYKNGKKITNNQKQGIEAEKYFDYFATTYLNLLPSKVINDFGIDFIASIINSENNEVLPKFIGFFVRSTSKKISYIKIDSDEANLFLKSDFPLILVIIDKKKDNFKISFLFQDNFLIKKISEMKKNNNKSIRIYFKDCEQDIGKIKKIINIMKNKNYMESLRKRIREILIESIIPNSTITIIQNKDMSFSIIESMNIEDFIDLRDINDRDKLLSTLFGDNRFIGNRLNNFSIRNDVINYFNYLPNNNIIFKVPTYYQGDKITIYSITNDKKIGCNFECRIIKGYYGYYHKSGLSLIISERELHNGQYIHRTMYKIDKEVNSYLYDYLDLCNFLENCTHDSFLKIGNKNFKIPATAFNLQIFSSFINYLKIIPKDFIIENLWKIEDLSEEDLQSLRAISLIYSNKNFLKNFGFIISNENNNNNFIEEKILFEIPLCMNIKEKGLICWLKCNGCFITNKINNKIIGLKINDVINFKFEKHNKLFPTNGFPKFKINEFWPAISFYNELVNKDIIMTKNNWGVNLKIINQNNKNNF